MTTAPISDLIAELEWRGMLKDVTAIFDGHAEMMGWDGLNDMRYWADMAEWELSPRRESRSPSS